MTTPADMSAEIKRLHHEYARTRVPGPELFDAIHRLEAAQQHEPVDGLLTASHVIGRLQSLAADLHGREDETIDGIFEVIDILRDSIAAAQKPAQPTAEQRRAELEPSVFATWKGQPYATERAVSGPIEAAPSEALTRVMEDIEFGQKVLDWNRSQSEPPIKIGREYSVATALRVLLSQHLRAPGEDTARLRDLFVRYMAHVGQEEGTVFIPHPHAGFTPDEIAELEAIDASRTTKPEA